MDSHDLAEMLAGLASRTNNLSVLTTGDDCRTLMEQQDRLSNLAMVAIKQDMDENDSTYSDAINQLKTATQIADAATKNIKKISDAISSIARVTKTVISLLKLE